MPRAQNLRQLLAVVRDAAARTAHREARPQDDRIADPLRKLQPVFDVVHQLRLGHIKPDFPHRVFEQQPVFCFLDGARYRPR